MTCTSSNHCDTMLADEAYYMESILIRASINIFNTQTAFSVSRDNTLYSKYPLVLIRTEVYFHLKNNKVEIVIVKHLAGKLSHLTGDIKHPVDPLLPGTQGGMIKAFRSNYSPTCINLLTLVSLIHCLIFSRR